MQFKKASSIFSLLLSIISCLGCNKLTQVPEPVNTITSTEVFSTNATATSAIVGIYNDMITGTRNGIEYGNGLITFDAGMAADELLFFGGSSNFETNTLNPAYNTYQLWSFPYYDIYLANAAIEKIAISTGMTANVKKQLTGEAYFLRAYCYFYLINLFGDVPLVTTTAYAYNDTISRKPTAQIYTQIIADLKSAQNLLASDYSISGGERVRVNQFGATALLARAYLYTKAWDLAETQATSVINNSSLYALTSLDSVFLANSQEAILQLEVPNTPPYATLEGNQLIPYDSTANPTYYMTSQLLRAFEPADQRYTVWVDSTDYSGTYYYYPLKYRVYVGTKSNITEFYMLLRLAEQYLIRAESRAEKNANLVGAIADLNVIRERAGLDDLPNTLTQTQVLAAVAQERRIELFSEWGHRWLDLKRTGQATTVLGSIKPSWTPNAQLWPIPQTELTADANITQNLGYH